MFPQCLSIRSITWSRYQVVMSFALDDLSFSTSYWYPDTDLIDLEQRFGHAVVEKIFVHAALFELNKIASLRPKTIDLGPYAHHHTQALERLWNEVFQKVWAQWRFENNLPLETPPPFLSRAQAEGTKAVQRDSNRDELLLFCGGGKDSLVTMKLLERAEIPFASMAYTSSVYGVSKPQLKLINGLLDQGCPTRRHTQIVQDDFFDAPVIDLFGKALGVNTITAAETPSSIFATLPILLAHGYPYAALGHEKSANHGNLVWDVTGEEVNHQWGKSIEAEALLDEYVRSELVSDIGVFSLLMPIYDVVIFELLRQDEPALHATHSCNIAKPWCKRCPKCAYVWLNYRAHLSEAPVTALFGEDLLEVPENFAFFRDMMGLGEHTPFECIGQVEESRLALALCQARGLLGPNGHKLASRLPPLNPHDILESFTRVDGDIARLPAKVAPRILSQMEAASSRCQQRILNLLD